MFYFWYITFWKNYNTFFKILQKALQPLRRFLLNFVAKFGLVFLFVKVYKKFLDYKNYNPKNIALWSFFVLAFFSSLILSGFSFLDQEKLLADANTITETIDFKQVTPDYKPSSLNSANLACFDYYENISLEAKPENFLNLYLVEDKAFLLRTLALEEDNDFLTAPLRQNQIITYVVKSGDSLGKIANSFGINVDTIKLANNLQKTILTPGQELIILPISGIYYQVKKGDTLSSIALKHKISANLIKEYNDLKNDVLKIGQKIILPGAKGVISQPLVVSKNTATTGFKVDPTTVATSNYYIYPTTGWNWGEAHGIDNRAVDIANACGTPIYASANGIVIEVKASGYNGGYGLYTKIQHENGTSTLYAHLSSLNVSNGQYVNQGQIIGKMGSTGRSTGCHLHFEVIGAKNPFIKR